MEFSQVLQDAPSLSRQVKGASSNCILVEGNAYVCSSSGSRKSKIKHLYLSPRGDGGVVFGQVYVHLS